MTSDRPTGTDPFVDRVMRGVARQERLLPRVSLALAALALALAVPALFALRARAAIDAGLALGLAVAREVVSAAGGGPGRWVAVGLLVVAVAALATIGTRGRP